LNGTVRLHVLISTDDFNDVQANGLIIMPMISAKYIDLGKFKVVPSTWVKVISQGEPGYVLVEQIRYIDRSRCQAQIGERMGCDLKQVGTKLKHFFPHNVGRRHLQR
jgi:mRNA-degrading endonuclease toxin of MazEF toxin-antitoxin module